MFKSNIIIYTFPGAKYFVQNLFIWYTSYFKRLYYYFFGTVSTYTISYFTKTTSHPRENAFITSICVKKLANNCHYAGASKFWKGSFALENRTPIKLWKRWFKYQWEIYACDNITKVWLIEREREREMP